MGNQVGPEAAQAAADEQYRRVMAEPKVGDQVRVTGGRHTGTVGFVVAVFDTKQGGGTGYARGGYRAVNLRTPGGSAVCNVPLDKVVLRRCPNEDHGIDLRTDGRCRECGEVAA